MGSPSGPCLSSAIRCSAITYIQYELQLAKALLCFCCNFQVGPAEFQIRDLATEMEAWWEVRPRGPFLSPRLLTAALVAVLGLKLPRYIFWSAFLRIICPFLLQILSVNFWSSYPPCYEGISVSFKNSLLWLSSDSATNPLSSLTTQPCKTLMFSW